MNDRAVSLLEQYELNILRTYKGRGCILCETEEGLKIFQEYHAPQQKLTLMEHLLENISTLGLVDVDSLVASKEGTYSVKDRDGVVYVLKNYYTGNECSPGNKEELSDCMHTMAMLHTGMFYPKDAPLLDIRRFDLYEETARHNRMLRKIRKYLRERGSKTPFEQFLLSEYDTFLNCGLAAEERLGKEDFASFYQSVEKQRSFIHGDYQYHNVLLCGTRRAVVNFERCRFDSRVGDLALFLRKIMEKYDWDPTFGMKLLQEYEAFTPLKEDERRQLFYRLSYPEKFRKIVSAYYNSNKAFQSVAYGEKLLAVCAQEEKKQNFLRKVFDDVIE
ncbi:MAG: CotS family spore coat protein [Lachnospiraceae bacterium]|nr:CotS family spore coat protein [Lachnospiraceae bacterium]